MNSTENSDDIDTIKDIKEQPLTCPTSFDIVSWYENITKSTLEPLPLILSSFKRGVIDDQSVNDILMIKGLIDPPVHIQFLDLSSFSRF
jgi:hypothetical protein